MTISCSPLSLGNIAEGSAVICANTGLAIAARKMTTRSCAVDAPEPPGPSRPDGVVAWVDVAPRVAALAFILATVTSWPPSMCANVLAASLPDTSNRPSSSWRAV
ncbi:Uncharacterised protein [Mycobacterium tuberculosis]|nr:Uncharacterised protein [Mycobacterium tuberculosis]